MTATGSDFLDGNWLLLLPSPLCDDEYWPLSDNSCIGVWCCARLSLDFSCLEYPASGCDLEMRQEWISVVKLSLWYDISYSIFSTSRPQINFHRFNYYTQIYYIPLDHIIHLISGTMHTCEIQWSACSLECCFALISATVCCPRIPQIHCPLHAQGTLDGCCHCQCEDQTVSLETVPEASHPTANKKKAENT